MEAKRPRIDGNKVERLRWQKELTASELARQAGTSRQHLARIRHAGYNASPGLQKRIADVLGVTVAEIQQDRL
jgi:transcriptional regulator with XRE-family HTH domain